MENCIANDQPIDFLIEWLLENDVHFINSVCDNLIYNISSLGQIHIYHQQITYLQYDDLVVLEQN